MGNIGSILWLIGLSVMTFFAVAWLMDLNNRQRELQTRLERIFTDKEGQDLSQPLEALSVRLDVNDEQVERLRQDIDQLTARFPDAVQAIGLVRFQALSDYGGDQSFALALTDSAGDGVVISSIFAREGTRVYAKPLQAWSSSYSTSFEEEEAIRQAQSQLSE